MQKHAETSRQTIREGNALGKDGLVALLEGPEERFDSFDVSEEWALACRVAASKGMSKSALLPKFLLYICEQSLRGNSRDLTEQRLGATIFNRATNYNPGEDNIVRSYARTLRRRLDEYFETEGKNEAMRIVVPRGGYVPVFERVIPGLQEFEANTVGDSQPASGLVAADATKSSFPKLALTAVTAFMAGVIVCGGALHFLRQPQEKQRLSPAHPIWAEVFRENHDSLIVPADSGFGILQNLSERTVPLQEYANGSYFADTMTLPGVNAESIVDIRQQRYTSLVDLNITASILQLPESSAARTEIRYARNLTIEDLKSSNVILLGSIHSNPWVSLFEDKLNFKLTYMPRVNQSFVRNEQPAGNEQKQYSNETGSSANRTYGVIDYLPNLGGNGHVLIIQGLNMAATQAAADTLFRADAMNSIMKQAVRPDGSVKPFELLVKTSSIGGTDPGSEIIATRFY